MSRREYVQPSGVAPPPDAYTHVIRAGDAVYIAGQTALDVSGVVVGIGDPVAQAEMCWQNIQRCLASVGASVSDVVKVVAFLKDIRHMEAEMSVRMRLFEPGRYPAYTMVQVANLAWDSLLMEIDVTAVLPDRTPSSSEGDGSRS